MEEIVKALEEFLASTRTDAKLDYWYPIQRINDGVRAVAYDIDAIYRDGRVDLVEKVVRRCGIGSVMIVQMGQKTAFFNDNLIELLYEKDNDGFNFPWEVETYYFDDTKSWLIYVSHEGTITFAGDALARAAEEILPKKYVLNYV